MKLSHLESISSLAIVGATGLVGQECLAILSEHKIKFQKLKLLASGNSAGEYLEVGSERIAVEELTPEAFEGVEVAFFSTPTEVTEKYVPAAVERGCLVIDDSNCFRMQPNVALVVPQVNGAILKDFEGRIIATPNCTTTPLAVVLKPLADAFGIERVVVSTYQSVSGAGRRANEELSHQCAALLNGQGDDEPQVFPHPIAFNCIPRIGKTLESGYTDEEQKVSNELRKILGLPNLKVTTTAIRVPTFTGHGLSATVELKQECGSIEEVRAMLDQFPGLRVLDKPDADIYPTNREVTGADYTFVGRLRRDPTVKSGLSFWVMADNLRKGAALNVLEILSTLYGYRRMN
jgi:aspartate-semialdehyde dehydrogenase